MSQEIVIRRISVSDGPALGDFFVTLATDGDTIDFFHPHPFTREYADELCSRSATRKDCYYVACFRGIIVAYMMLRGWDEGYSVPSFGVCNLPALRDVGLGQVLLSHAVAECRAVDAKQLRLTVFKNNERAVHVYRKFGFVFKDKNENELIGILDLGQSPSIRVRPLNLSKIIAWFEALQSAA